MTNRLSLCALVCCLCASYASAQTRQYEIPVNDFTELYVMDGVNVVYHAEAAGENRVVFTADTSNASLVTVEPKKEKLTIRLSEEGLQCKTLPTLDVYSTMLFKVQNNGDSLVRVDSNPRVPRFQARLEGNGTLEAENINAAEVNVKKFTGKGTIVVTGVCESASIGNTGSGIVNCAGLKAAQAKCNLLGTGTIYVYCSGELSVTGVSGNVFYTGNPSLIKSRALSVKMGPIEQQPAE